MANVTDARYSTHNYIGGDQINNHYMVSHMPPPSSLSFNDAPIDLLSDHFTGREEELKHIENALDVTYGDTPTRFVVRGPPGIGKTQLLLQYVKLSFDKQYSIIFWISGATVEKANQGLAKVLTLVGHPDRDHQDQSIRLTLAQRWLEESNTSGMRRWLLVFDNVAPETVSFLKENLPRRNPSGNILFTTRTGTVADALASVAGKKHQVFELQAPDLRNATKQLLDEAGIDMNGPESGTKDKAEALVKCIGCLPLAISQAASFAKTPLMNLDGVLDLYNSSHKYEMISWNNTMSNYEHKSVAMTIATLLKELSPDCSNFLKVLSFFDPECIPVDMITEGAKELQLQSGLDLTSLDNIPSAELKSLAALVCSPVELPSTIDQFYQLSLVRHESSKGTGTLHIHDLTQIMIQESAKTDGRQYHWFRVAALFACGAFRNVDDPQSHFCWARCETLTPHIHALTRWNDEHAAGDLGLEEANIGIARYLSSRGRFNEAETLFTRALAGNARLFGPEQIDKMWILEELAVIYRQQGRYEEAETLLGQVLLDGDIFGDKSVDTLQTVHNLATVYRYQGRYNEANTLLERALEAREKVLGPMHPDTLHTVNYLAIICRLQGRYNESKALCERALAGREKLLGFEHPDTLQTVNSLALVYKLQKQYEEAEALCMRAMKGREKSLGPEHPETLMTVHNLAAVYRLQKRYQEAKKLCKQVAAASAKVLGLKHPKTLWSLNNLAIVYLLQGQHEEAEEMTKQVLAVSMEQLGFKHYDTLQTMDTLAHTYNAQGRYGEAEMLYKQVLAGYEELLGLEHPETLLKAQNLAEFFKQQGRHQDKALLQEQFPFAF